ncbi:MAG: hypothetical protein C5B49_03195 [Bdellovibrio sp.]|nr:MAG: hypothetical protein C5B49_03195 [Bdellovibrio sp.]
MLEDTLVGFRLPAWRPQLKVRESTHPKFYWFDTGVARGAAGLIEDQVDSSWLGTAFETWMLHEIRAHNSYSRKNRGLFYYALPSDLEVDLIIETRKQLRSRKSEIVAIEFKLSKRWQREWERPIGDIAVAKKVDVAAMYGVYNGDEILQFDNFSVLPVAEFLNRLHSGKIF